MSQLKLAHRYLGGDLEVGRCTECDCYYTQTFNPRTLCDGCHREQPRDVKEARRIQTRNMRNLEKGSLTGPQRVQNVRNEILKAIRKGDKTIPKYERPREVTTKKLENVIRIKRDCLRCNKKFTTDSKFRRLCTVCHNYSLGQCMDQYVHYMGV